MKEVLLPSLDKVAFDHAPSVRKQLVATLATWFARIETIRQFDAVLLPLLLAGVVDESPEVRSAALAKLNELSTTWERDEDGADNSAQAEADPMEVDSDFSAPPLYFPTRPPHGAREMATRYSMALLLLCLPHHIDVY